MCEVHACWVIRVVLVGRWWAVSGLWADGLVWVATLMWVGNATVEGLRASSMASDSFN